MSLCPWGTHFALWHGFLVLCVSILLFLFTLLLCGTKHMASLFLSWTEMSKLDLWTPTSVLAFTATYGSVLCPSFPTSNNLQMQETTSYSVQKSSMGWIWSAGYSLPMHILGNPEALSEMCARMLLVSQFSSLLWLCSRLVTGCLRVVPRAILLWCNGVKWCLLLKACAYLCGGWTSLISLCLLCLYPLSWMGFC